MSTTTYKKKLIEVALPLEAINRESAREKSIRHGHPSTLHLWWSRKPLAACRAVLFASLVDDPSAHPDQFPTAEDQERERERLFKIIEELVLWENTTNEEVLDRARAEIMKSTDNNPPPVLDPFCGGGSIPLEAQRLGLEAHGSDLNPVAVLITKALIEIPPKFAGQPPVNPDGRPRDGGDGQASQGSLGGEAFARAAGRGKWQGASGLAADIRYYGQWMRDEAEKRIGHLYPKVELPVEQGGGRATVIAWLWARTVQCPNPACGAQMPLTSKLEFSKKKGQRAWIEPEVHTSQNTVSFRVRTGTGEAPKPPKIGRGAKFRCLACGQVAEDQHIKNEALAQRMGSQLLAVVAKGAGGRAYVSPTSQQVDIAAGIPGPATRLGPMAEDPRNIWCVGYGLEQFEDLFTHRQLVALTTFSSLVGEAREKILEDAVAVGLDNDPSRSRDGGKAAPAYADAVATYLAFGVSRSTDFWNSIATWMTSGEFISHMFVRQAIPMSWDFAEANPFSDASGNWDGAIDWIARSVERLPARAAGRATQSDALSSLDELDSALISTDPPYYDNISYADLSDHFYVWFRKTLGEIYPDLLSTLLTPKSNELIANPYRHGGDRNQAEGFFETGLEGVFSNIRNESARDYPFTLYYAFKQAETEVRGASRETASTGWETMLTALVNSGFTIVGTWPMRTERGSRLLGIGMNALASSVVLACRPRPAEATRTVSTDFLRELRRQLPGALRTLQHGNIAPVDLAQAAIGPGMAIFSKYRQVIEPDGSPMRVRRALELINQVLDETLAEQENEFDRDTRWAVGWFEQYGMNEGPYGQAELLSQAKNSSIGGLEQAGIVESGRGKVRLLRRDEFSDDWDPSSDSRLPIWEATQRLIQALDTDGEDGAAHLLSQIPGSTGEVARDLAYRLYTICERKDWAQEALSYNALVTAWPDVTRQAADYRQGRLV